MNANRLTVLHIITGLSNGGAEGALYRLCTNDTSNTHIVVSMMGQGKYGPLLIQHGIKVICLNMPKGKPKLSAAFKLLQILRKSKPDVVQTWMYHADLFGGVLARIAGYKNIFWNVRQSNFDKNNTNNRTIVISKFLAKLSFVIPKKIICCASSAANIHGDKGYDRKKLVVIENGYDFNQFNNVGPEQIIEIRTTWERGLENTFLIGMVGRFDAQKDHKNLLYALSKLKQLGKLKFKCILVGPNIDELNNVLMNWIADSKLQDDVILLGQRSDIPVVMAALDLHVLSSAFGEAFPNVVAEAMAAGTPCVVTDVGDAARIVGDIGWVVPPSDSTLLAQSISTAAQEFMNDKTQWQERQSMAKKKIQDNFSIERMVQRYVKCWRSN